jgi:hypothetical protein
MNFKLGEILPEKDRENLKNFNKKENLSQSEIHSKEKGSEKIEQKLETQTSKEQKIEKEKLSPEFIVKNISELLSEIRILKQHLARLEKEFKKERAGSKVDREILISGLKMLTERVEKLEQRARESKEVMEEIPEFKKVILEHAKEKAKKLEIEKEAEIKAKEKLIEHLHKETSEEKAEKKIEISETKAEKEYSKENVKDKLKNVKEKLDGKREEYRDVYLGAVKLMEKKEMEALKKIRNESEGEIKERVKEILEGKPEEVEKNKKEFIEFLKRKFEEKGITISNEKAEKILEVELKKGEYDKVKIEWVRAIKESGMKDYEIIKELAKEIETLKNLEIEKWPPEKKSIFAKVLDGWIKLPSWQRIALSSLVLTTVAALFPGILPSTAAFCAKYGFLGTVGFRIGRGILGSSIAQVIGGAFEKFWGSFRIEKKKSESLKELAERGITLENLNEVDSKIQEILNETAKSKRRMKIAKGLVMLATGAGTSMALTVGAEEVFGAEVRKETVLETKPKGEVSETDIKESGVEAESKSVAPEILFAEKYLGIETVERGESILSEAKKIYMEHARELGYKGDLADKVALKRWAEIASTRHLVGQYIVEHPEEFKSLIEKIGAPPKPTDPEYFTKLDEWLHKVPKSTFEDILHNKVPNLVYEGDKIVVTKSGDILALSPEGKLRLGHIPVETREHLIEGVRKPEVSESFVEKREEVGVCTTIEEGTFEEIPVKKIPTTEEVGTILWEKLKIVRAAFERVQNERVLNFITDRTYEYYPGTYPDPGEELIAQDTAILKKEVLRIYNSLSLKEKAEVQLISVDEFLRKYSDKILEKK